MLALALALPISKKQERKAQISGDLMKHSTSEITAEKKVIKEQTERDEKPADLIEKDKSKLCLDISLGFSDL